MLGSRRSKKRDISTVFWVDIDLAIQKGLTFYQTRSNAIILQETFAACCIRKVVGLKTGEVLFEKSCTSPRPTPKIPLRHDHDWTKGKFQLGSTVDQQPVGKLLQQSFGEAQHAKILQINPIQTQNQSVIDRGNLIAQNMCLFKGETSRSHEIDEKGLHERT